MQFFLTARWTSRLVFHGMWQIYFVESPAMFDLTQIPSLSSSQLLLQEQLPQWILEFCTARQWFRCKPRKNRKRIKFEWQHFQWQRSLLGTELPARNTWSTTGRMKQNSQLMRSKQGDTNLVTKCYPRTFSIKLNSRISWRRSYNQGQFADFFQKTSQACM